MLSSNCQQSCGRCPTCPAPSHAAAPPSTAPAASPLAPAPAPASDQPPAVPPPAAPSETGLAPLPEASAAPAAAAPPPSPPQQEASASASPQDLVQPLLAELPGSLPAGASSGGAAAVAGGGGGNCTTDVLDFARGAPDLTLFLALASLSGWQQQRLADPQLAATLLLPTDDAIRAFLAQQGLTSSTVYLYSEQLESVLAYHTLPQPLSYADLERAAASGAQLPTDLPGAFLTADQVNSTALRVVGGAKSAFLQRANILLCRTVVHVVDAVLMPTRSLQQVLPYNQAVGGLQAAGIGQPIGPPPSAEPGQPACYPSIAAAVNANPQLSIFKTVLGLSGWDLSNPGLSITLFATNDAAQQAAISGYLDPGQRELQQLLGEAAKDTRLLHASIAYQIVPMGGLTTRDLEQYIGEELPTVFEGHYITLEPGVEDGSLSVAGEFLPTNQSVNLVSEARTCGGSVIHVIDGSLQARTPLVDQYEAGTPLRDLNLSAGYEQYNTARAQAEVDATADGHAPPPTAELAAIPAAAAPPAANAPTPPAPPSPPAAAAAAAAAAPASPPPAATSPPASLRPTAPTEAAATETTTEAAGGSSAAAAAPDGSAAQPAPASASANGGAAPASEGGGSGSDGGNAAALSAARGPLPRLQLPAGSSVAIQATRGTGTGTDAGTASGGSSGTAASPAAAAAAATPVPPPAGQSPAGPTAATNVAVAPPAAAGGGSGLAGTTAGTASGGAAPGGTAAGGTTPGAASSNGSPPGGTAISGGGTASSGTAASDGTALNCVTLKDLVEGDPQYFSRISQLAGQFGWDVVPPANSVTYMVPTDTALNSLFASLDPQTAQALLLNAPALSALAAYHTVNQSVRTDSMADGQQLPTLAYDAQGRQLSLTVRRGSGGAASDIRFQGIGSTALLLVPDVPICGGTVQVVDTVLLPVQVPTSPTPPGGAAG
ncbi:hypothetical protein D9Q98_009819 [Chlorella vulgaris]|uniref:FAS1 domain-containing protein n=1 Tax=Chlorella vulgaris TaxID=3077 RepID=A0A9D4TF59_CHLVU|nr:hypothetical protein D9Q98_009819 [Chlorella vulgaris]